MKRMLSALLALALCLSLTAPVSLAADEAMTAQDTWQTGLLIKNVKESFPTKITLNGLEDLYIPLVIVGEDSAVTLLKDVSLDGGLLGSGLFEATVDYNGDVVLGKEVKFGGETPNGVLKSGGSYDLSAYDWGTFFMPSSQPDQSVLIVVDLGPAEEDEDRPSEVYDDLGNVYVGSNPVAATSELTDMDGVEHVRYIYPVGTVMTAPAGITFEFVLGESIIYPDVSWGYVEGSGTLHLADGAMVYEVMTSAGTTIYLGTEPREDEAPPEPEMPPALAFDDVPEDAYYYHPVQWAIDREITTGKTNTSFAPDDTCTQAQIITFICRAEKGEIFEDSNPYTNSAVTADQYFFVPLLWAYKGELVTDADLDPDAGCTRSDVVLYLWRLAGCPAASGTSFTDVPADAEYAQAVAWALDEGITTGTTTTTFTPDKVCTRGEIVTFLYRSLAE